MDFRTKKKHTENLNNLMIEFQKNMSEVVVEYQNSIKEFSSKFAEIIKNLPSDLTYSQKEYLFEQGWYLSGNLSINYPRVIRDLIDKKQYKELEKILMEYIKNIIPEIKEKIKKSFPNRKKILEEALKAHEENRYILSIPIFLIQAEGICRETIDISPYLGGRNLEGLSKIKNKMEKKLNQYSVNGINLKVDSFTEILLQYLLNETDINRNINKAEKKQEKDRKYKSLSRNYIIHGFSVDYASEANSYKAISFLNFILDLKNIFIALGNRKAEFERIIKNIK
jgi:hypothetical protein